MFRGRSITLLIVFGLFAACFVGLTCSKKGSNPDDKQNALYSPVTATGTIVLPVGSNIDKSSLTVTAGAFAQGKPNAAGSFSINLNKGVTQLISVSTAAGDLVSLAVSIDPQEDAVVALTSQSTAEALIYLNPFVVSVGPTMSQTVMSLIKSLPETSDLGNLIDSKMHNDPSVLLSDDSDIRTSMTNALSHFFSALDSAQHSPLIDDSTKQLLAEFSVSKHLKSASTDTRQPGKVLVGNLVISPSGPQSGISVSASQVTSDRYKITVTNSKKRFVQGYLDDDATGDNIATVLLKSRKSLLDLFHSLEPYSKEMSSTLDLSQYPASKLFLYGPGGTGGFNEMTATPNWGDRVIGPVLFTSVIDFGIPALQVATGVQNLNSVRFNSDGSPGGVVQEMTAKMYEDKAFIGQALLDIGDGDYGSALSKVFIKFLRVNIDNPQYAVRWLGEQGKSALASYAMAALVAFRLPALAVSGFEALSTILDIGTNDWLATFNLTDASAIDVTPPAKITNLSARAVRPTRISLEWTAPGDDGSLGQASAYDIRYSTVTLTESNWAEAAQVAYPISPSVTGTSDAQGIGSLLPNTTYYFAVKTADEVRNWSELSNVAAVTTLEQFITNVVASPDSAQVGGSITVSWQSTKSIDVWVGFRRSGASAYYVDSVGPFYSLIGSNLTVCNVPNGTNSPSANLAGANRFVDVYWRDNDAGVTGRDTVDIDGFVVSSPNGGEVWQAGGEYYISWTKQGDHPWIDIYCSTDGGVTWPILLAPYAPADWSPLGGTIPSTIVSSTRCRIKIQDKYNPEMNDVSDTDFTITSSSQIDTVPPAAVTNLVAGNPTTSTITLTWTAPGDDGNAGTANEYDIRYSTSQIQTEADWNSATQASGEPAPNTAGNSESFTVSGLSSSTTYYFALKTADEVPNWSGLSNVPSATTSGSSGSWSALGAGMNGPVFALAVYNGKLIAGGSFTTAGGVSANYVAAWDGNSWAPLGSGLDGNVYELTVYNGKLIAGGNMRNWIAAWDGSSWSPIGSVMGGTVYSLTVFGNQLIAGGVSSFVYAWNGSSWSALGFGMAYHVRALIVYQNQLIAGGDFAAGGPVIGKCVVWNGSTWSTLGSDMSGGSYPTSVYSLTIEGNSLIAGGSFTSAGGVSANYLASWDGTSWSPLGSGMNTIVNSLCVFNNQLIAGGSFTSAGGVTAKYAASWDGTSWSQLGSGMSDGVYSLLVYNDKLIAGGGFTTAGGNTVNRIAAWSQ
jgi:hypothetical protein